jgi:hypothetical protein
MQALLLLAAHPATNGISFAGNSKRERYLLQSIAALSLLVFALVWAQTLSNYLQQGVRTANDQKGKIGTLHVPKLLTSPTSLQKVLRRRSHK